MMLPTFVFELFSIDKFLTRNQFTVTANGKPGSTPAAKRRALRHVYTPPSEAKRAVVPRADAAESSLTLVSSVIAHGFESSGGTTSGDY